MGIRLVSLLGAFLEIAPDWKQSAFAGVIQGFEGEVLQGDGYPGYVSYVSKHEGIVLAGCMDHARRKFHQAAKSGCELSQTIMHHMSLLYRIERELKLRGANRDERQRVRQEKALPVFDTIDKLVNTIVPRPKSLTHEAVTYMKRQRAPLRAYLHDGRIEISNIAVEQLIRRVAIFRKNSLFYGSFAGAARICNLMTVLMSVVLAKVCPWRYFTDVFTKLADGWPQRRIGELVPYRWGSLQVLRPAEKLSDEQFRQGTGGFVLPPMLSHGVHDMANISPELVSC